MPFYIDQLNRKVEIDKDVCRIISIVPSQTELLFDLGLNDKVVGITKFCVHPSSWKKEKTLVGGTKKINIDKIKSLNPDLIIGNKEENTKEDILELEKIAPVWLSDIVNLQDTYKMINEIGLITKTSAQASIIIQQIKENFANLTKFENKKSVVYLIWKNPYMTAANNTFINSMLSELGFINFFKNEERYPIWDHKNTKSPDYIFLSSEPYPFKNKDIDELKAIHPSSKIVIVNGEYFSWYGSRLIGATIYFKKLLEMLKN